MTQKEFSFYRLINEPDYFLKAPRELRKNKAFIKQCANESTGDFFIYVDDPLKQDEDFVFECASLTFTFFLLH